MKNITWLDVASVVSTIAVVALHMNGVYWSHPKGWLWINSSLIECIGYFAVPVFFMISGVSLLDYRDRYDDLEFLRRRSKRTLIPFLFWSSVAFIAYGDYVGFKGHF